jgi:hypothetical protein
MRCRRTYSFHGEEPDGYAAPRESATQAAGFGGLSEL